MKFFKNIIFAALAVAVAGIVSVGLINLKAGKTGEDMTYGADTAPSKQAVLVLGAKVHEEGRLSDMFRDRVETAIGLYETGKVRKILVSGDHGQQDYDEVNAARDYLLAKGIPSEDIFLDHAGFDTYDSVYRARDVFMAESLIIVTQSYHLPRALYIAERLGVDAVGVSADRSAYGGQEARDLREKFATVKAWLDVVLRSEPEYLGEPIPLSGEAYASWD